MFAGPSAASGRMSRQRVRDTAPEVAVRRALFASGERFRVCYPVPGRSRCSIDVAFPRRRVAVFVDGCFWHGCREHGTTPRTNTEAWTAKIRRNRERDRQLDDHLRAQSWQVVRAWEHEDPRLVGERVLDVLASSRIRRGER